MSDSCDHDYKLNPDWISINESTKIYRSGNYILTRDIVGRIVIKANNVQLNMNGKTIIPCKCHNQGIVAICVKKLRIFNGCITGAKKYGIHIFNCTDVKIKNLLFTKCCHIAALIVDTSGLNIEYFTANDCNRGLVLYKCSTVKMKYGTFEKCDNRDCNLIGIEDCDTIFIKGYQIHNNNKCLNEMIDINDNEKNGLFTIQKSKNVNMFNCQFNSNKKTNNNSQLICICITESDNCSLINCETNFNEAEYGYLVGIGAYDCGHIYLLNCKSNDNLLYGETGKGGFLHGFLLCSVETCVMRRCDANGNTSNYITTGVTIKNLDGLKGEARIVESTFNSNYGMETAAGILAFLVNNIYIDRCQCDHNESKLEKWLTMNLNIESFAAGIWIGRVNSVNVYNSTCNSNVSIFGNGIGMCFDFLTLHDDKIDFFGPSNIKVNNCFANNNKSTNKLGIGISIEGLLKFKKTRNVRIKETQCSDNSHHGYLCSTSNNVVFENCKADNNLASGFHYIGICFNICTLRCMSKNNNIGYYITGINRGYFEDNQALGNITFGFKHTNRTLDSTFIGNYADSNNTNYSITGGIIDLFKLDHTTGIYTNISGNDTLTKWSNIEV